MVLHLDFVHYIAKHLSIGNHPVAIEKEEDGDEAEEIHAIFHHIVVHIWRFFVHVGDHVALYHPKDEE